MKGAISTEKLARLSGWRNPPAGKNEVKGSKGEYLALDGSCQRGFQNFLFLLAKSKTRLSVINQSLCLTCHVIGGKGIGFAPPLDGFAARDLDGVITAIIHPNAAIENVFRAYRIHTKDGKTYEGFNQSEVRGAVSLVSMGGATQSIPVKNIQKAGYVDGRSVMPNLAAGMGAGQIASIIAYLRSVGKIGSSD